jgi:hypothetical protein
MRKHGVRSGSCPLWERLVHGVTVPLQGLLPPPAGAVSGISSRPEACLCTAHCGRHTLYHQPPCLSGCCSRAAGTHCCSVCAGLAPHRRAAVCHQVQSTTLAPRPVLNPRAALCAASVLCLVPCMSVCLAPPNAALLPQRAREKDRERERDRQRDMERERARYIKADLEVHDSDDDREPWQRRSLRHS